LASEGVDWRRWSPSQFCSVIEQTLERHAAAEAAANLPEGHTEQQRQFAVETAVDLVRARLNGKV
jgi:hypothetical protein